MIGALQDVMEAVPDHVAEGRRLRALGDLEARMARVDDPGVETSSAESVSTTTASWLGIASTIAS